MRRFKHSSGNDIERFKGSVLNPLPPFPLGDGRGGSVLLLFSTVSEFAQIVICEKIVQHVSRIKETIVLFLTSLPVFYGSTSCLRWNCYKPVWSIFPVKYLLTSVNFYYTGNLLYFYITLLLNFSLTFYMFYFNSS